MKFHDLKVVSSHKGISQKSQLAYKIAQVASADRPIDSEAEEMVINRIIDNVAVAVASLNRTPVVTARAQALAHPHSEGATLFGLPSTQRVCAEWAAWANGTAVRELDYHDTFLAADYSHPGDNIPPLLAVAQQKKQKGKDLLKSLLVAYEIHISLVKAICLHKHKVDHMAHLCPASATGIGVLLNLPVDVIYQSIQQALHTSITTRQSRKGEISSWKAFVPGHSGKLAIESVDRSMRGEKSPSPIYEGEDSVVAWFLDGPEAHYKVPLPEEGEPLTGILESYTKEHSAEYQSQALIDLAFEMRGEIENFEEIEAITIYTSHHTHFVIGTGSGDPQKFDPQATRETLDHSIMYIFAVALQDGFWHHVKSYTPERAQREDTVRLWRKISTKEDPYWTGLYHSEDPSKKSFGARVEIQFKEGSSLVKEVHVARAHPLGQRPFKRKEYIHKFDTLTEGVIEKQERNRFLSLVENLPDLSEGDVLRLNVEAPEGSLLNHKRDNKGIF